MSKQTLLQAKQRIIGGFIIFSTFITLIVLFSALTAAQDAPDGLTYTDPQGRYSVALGENWEVITLTDEYGQYHYTEAEIVVTFTAIALTDEIQDTETAVKAAAERIGSETVSFEGGGGAGGWDLSLYTLTDGQGLAAAAKLLGDSAVVMLVTGEPGLVLPPPVEITSLIERFTFTGGDAAGLPTTIEDFAAMLTEHAARDNVSLSVAVSVGGNTVYSAGFGSLDGTDAQATDADTVYQWGSSTKMVTATALMQVWEQGLVDLDAPVSTYLDYFPADYGITVKHLLTHTGGLPEIWDVTHLISANGGEQLDPSEVAREYAASITALDFEPGSANRYSNFGFLLLGEIVHEVSGVPYVDYVRQHILQPLGMTHTDFVYSETMLANAAQASDNRDNEDYLRAEMELVSPGFADSIIGRVDEDFVWVRPFNVLPPWGGLHGSPVEQLNFLNMHLNGGAFNNTRLLQPETVAKMQEVMVGTAESGFGLAWMQGELLDQHYIGHAGGGVGIGMDMMLFPDSGIAISVMSNRTGYNTSAIAEAALNVTRTLLGL